jgi:hypothetical protein
MNPTTTIKPSINCANTRRHQPLKAQSGDASAANVAVALMQAPLPVVTQPNIEEQYVLFVVCRYGFDGRRRRRTAGRHS